MASEDNGDNNSDHSGDSISHVSNSFSDSNPSDSWYTGEGVGVSPTFSEMDEVSRELAQWSNSMEFTYISESPPVVEEEEINLYPPEEEAYRQNNWNEACRWMGTQERYELVEYNPTPYFLPILNLGNNTPDGRFKISGWGGGDLVQCDRIADILNLRPREGCNRDQMRIEYVKGWVSNVRGGEKKHRGTCFARFRLYDGSSTIPVTIWNDSNTHPWKLTTGIIRESCVVVLYHVACFVDVAAPPGNPRHHLAAGLSNVLRICG